MSRILKKGIEILNVAEKPSIARKITELLSANSFSSEFSFSKYNPVYKFNFDLSKLNQNLNDANMIFTSVTGHLCNLSFTGDYKKWQDLDPFILFEAETKKETPTDKEPLLKNLHKLAGKSDYLILWLDCDREGEAIAYEVIEKCLEANPKLIIKRAHFSVVETQEIIHAIENLTEPNRNLASAVELRQELDLKIGSAFTVFQTIKIQKLHDDLKYLMLSYGPCQIPTLGFVVERFMERKNFVEKKFWYIEGSFKINDQEDLKLNWKKEKELSEKGLKTIYEEKFKGKDSLTAIFQNFTKTEKLMYKPYPLNTIFLQKLSSDHLNFSSDKTMQIAEKLYNKGFISYPRTETNIFSKSINLFSLISNLSQHITLGNYAKHLQNKNFFPPRNGKKDDKSHPPIFPAKLLCESQEERFEQEDYLLYDLIVRHFLASCSKDAKADEHILNYLISNEEFYISFLEIKERNYLDVYPYDVWITKTNTAYENYFKQFSGSYQNISNVKVDLKKGKTTPPYLLKESDLIELMDSNQIGTDATIHEHIKKIQERNYVTKRNNFFEPTSVGIALIETYKELGIKIFEPQLRADMEKEFKSVAEGLREKKLVLDENLSRYKEILGRIKENEGKFSEIFLRKYILNRGKKVSSFKNKNNNY